MLRQFVLDKSGVVLVELFVGSKEEGQVLQSGTATCVSIRYKGKEVVKCALNNGRVIALLGYTFAVEHSGDWELPFVLCSNAGMMDDVNSLMTIFDVVCDKTGEHLYS